ncbi:hypothetical protein B0T25DRAFT_240787 [Lasiosphaeria hispida]|uniref:Alpha/beta-hydrolase n=1 Tax=Lasiosphaeria hispida TaxID=260671 RepID=A0AAJ0HEW4_9PEZI|nr:hypothetical protein B0T25DRAFT_240787 [Lasiosphaeria hispida]
MQRRLLLKLWRTTLPRDLSRRFFSGLPSVEHVNIPAASTGNVVVSLHNISGYGPNSPLVIWIPPFSYYDGYDPTALGLPRWLERYPTAVLNYRWPGLYSDPPSPTLGQGQAGDGQTEPPSTPVHWPNPLHDLLFGYSWIVKTLSPPDFGRRDIYVYGSYLGASLGASLALTETHPHRPMGIRGFIAYNGIYNWTTFLPDHPIHKVKPKPNKGRGNLLSLGSIIDTPNFKSTDPPEDNTFNLLKQQAPALFGDSPANLFDPFASASLFFHNPGLLVPPDFTTKTTPASLLPTEWALAINTLAANSATTTHTRPPLYDDETCPAYDDDDNVSSLDGDDTAYHHSQNNKILTTHDAAISLLPKVPRRGALVFPPRASTLRIPDTLLLHHDPPRAPRSGRRLARKEKNNFRTQAEELAGLMRRSVEKLELKERGKWDADYEDPGLREEDAKRRVNVGEAVGNGEEDNREFGLGLGEAGQEVAAEWLRERMDG